MAERKTKSRRLARVYPPDYLASQEREEVAWVQLIQWLCLVGAALG